MKKSTESQTKSWKFDRNLAKLLSPFSCFFEMKKVKEYRISALKKNKWKEIRIDISNRYIKQNIKSNIPINITISFKIGGTAEKLKPFRPKI